MYLPHTQTSCLRACTASKRGQSNVLERDRTQLKIQVSLTGAQHDLRVVDSQGAVQVELQTQGVGGGAEGPERQVRQHSRVLTKDCRGAASAFASLKDGCVASQTALACTHVSSRAGTSCCGNLPLWGGRNSTCTTWTPVPHVPTQWIKHSTLLGHQMPFKTTLSPKKPWCLHGTHQLAASMVHLRALVGTVVLPLP
jgi:hypothetical protein